MSDYQALAQVATQIAVQVGTRVAITYGRRIFRRLISKELNTQLHFALIVNFYSRPDYQLVYEVLSKELRKYVTREAKNPKLNLGSQIKYEYYLSIISEQDYAALLNLLDNLPYAFYEIEEEIFTNTSLRASGARLFLWPSNLPNKISLDEFKDLLNEVYAFYRELHEQLMDYMKRKILHDLDVRLFMEFNLDPRSANVLQNIIKQIPEKMFKRNFYLNTHKGSFVVLLDDGSIINAIIECLGG